MPQSRSRLMQTTKTISLTLIMTLFAMFISAAPVLAQNVVISEFMANPVVVSAANGQWIELHNTTSVIQDISGFKVVANQDPSNTTQGSVTLPSSGITIAPNGYFLICANTNSATNGGLNCDIGGAPALNNSQTATDPNPSVGISDNTDTAVDQVAYGTTDVVNGQSTIVERDVNNQPALSQDDKNVYGANGNMGTPGRATDIDNPVLKINSPTINQKVSGQIIVNGDLSDANLKAFNVYLEPADSSGTRVVDYGWISAASNNLTNQELYKIDTILCPQCNDGQYKVFVTARDEYGKTTTKDVMIVIDNTAPTITASNKSTNDRRPGLSGTVNDPKSTVEIKLNGQTYQAINSGKGTWKLAGNIIASLSDRTYNIQAKATDEAGNIALTSARLTVDATAPVVTVNKLTTTDHSPTLSGKVDDNNATVKVKLDGKTYTAKNNRDGTWTLDGKLIKPLSPHGSYDITVTATDSFGNIGTDQTKDELSLIPDFVDTVSIKKIHTSPALGSLSYGSSVSGDASMLDTDGDGIPDSQDSTPNGEKDDSSKSDSDKVDSKKTKNDFDYRWVILTGAIIAFLWFLLKQRDEPGI